MSMGYIDPITKKYVKKAGNGGYFTPSVASETEAGLMSAEDKKKIEKSYTTDDVANATDINGLFNK